LVLGEFDLIADKYAIKVIEKHAL